MNIIAISLVSASLLALAVAALVMLTATVLATWARPKMSSAVRTQSEGAEGPHPPEVAVVVPARNEGQSIRGCIDSLLAQTYAGPISIHVLVDSGDDTTAVALRTRPLSPLVHIHELGCVEKAKKLNAILPTLQGDFVALLDADHEADVDWLEVSVQALLEDKEAAAVQATRRPLRLSTIPAMWDSAQNHVGNEVLDWVRTRLGLPVFFTGTTALFRLPVLKRLRFGESVTEDTELSLKLHLEGARIAKLSSTGSREHAPPGVRDFCRRRRRWSAGHTAVFARNIWAIVKQTRGRTRVALFAHGSVYLVAAIVLALLLTLSAYLVAQLRGELAVVVVLVSTALGLLVARGLTGRGGFRDGVVTTLWILPHVAFLTPYLLRLWGDEHAYYLVAFP